MSDTIAVPELCQEHQRRIVDVLRLGPADPWRSAVVVLSIAMFQVAAADDRVWQRCPVGEDGEKDAGGLTMVLAEIGCLGCWLRLNFEKVLVFAAQNGLSELAAITRDGERMKAFVEGLDHA